ncbi:MAG: SCO family protein [Hydrogenobacter thermophilus]|uniref:SCO family protein n=1 Tax=Hydrogenobacter thermophilus TaxID=940 RepID=UPI001C740968|nr:SCO family protein [Hydrogenobacter thermophilus]QWK20497.1 MAG: SCO family protein [Hydrogenobacter thermophilus]
MKKLALFITLMALTVFSFSCYKKHEFYGFVYDQPAYDFKLVDQDGKEVKLSDYTKQGKVVVIFFGYTHCPDICPTALTTLASMMKNLKEDERNKVQVLFISVDPERDTPSVLKGYVPFFYPTFVGLTGSQDEIKKVAKEYKVFYRKVKGESAAGYLIDHTATIYVVTPDMKIKLLYTPTKQSPEKMAKDIEYLLKS